MRAVLLAAIVSSVIHYTDNYVNLEDYPQPHWINHAVIPSAWALFTAFGIAGYLLYRRGRLVPAGLCLLVYSYTGLSSLGHYRFGPLSDFTPKMHIGILLDGVTGAAVFIVGVLLIVSRMRRSEPDLGMRR